MSPEIFAGVGQPVEQSSERTIYAINCQPADGEPHDLAGGVMQCYHLFPGIDLAYTQFRAGRCRMRERAFSDVLEIAYCQAAPIVRPDVLNASTSRGLWPFSAKVILP